MTVWIERRSKFVVNLSECGSCNDLQIVWQSIKEMHRVKSVYKQV